MNIYMTNNRWKWILSLVVIVIIASSIWYTNRLVREFAMDEQKNLIIWADAVKHRAELVKSTEIFFAKLQEEERSKVEILAQAMRMLVSDEAGDLTFYVHIISNNTTIPVIQTDRNYRIIGATNVDFDTDTVPYLRGDLLKEFSVYEPVKISTYGVVNYIFYKDSRHFTQLKEYLESLITDFFAETVINSASVPVIVTDSTKKNIIATSHFSSVQRTDTAFLLKAIDKMSSKGSPIELSLSDNVNYIFYQESAYLFRLKVFPIIQMMILFLFAVISYFLFSTARKSEQNQVWAGLAKETAHQLGTPLSSIMAWVELLKLKGETEIGDEINKDVERLEIIAKRFSKIGSEPKLEMADVGDVVEDSINYLKKRTSNKVVFTVNLPEEPVIMPLCVELFEWVIENLCKNAVDAMSGKGSIVINVFRDGKYCIIDVTDTGKGISRSMQKTIFNPGVTTKKRGWGLGLSLAKRIVEEFHKGKIFVKSSTINKGSTFRVVLKNNEKLLIQH